MNKVLHIKNNSQIQIEIKKSKFICFSFVVHSKQQIEDILDNLNKKYDDATHICYAYRCASQEKACDNGEPQGTAGKPILDCIKHKQLQDVLVVVVRYFGGIKLGAGGLVRAYSGGAKAVLDASEFVEQIKCNKLDFIVEFSQQKTLQSLLQNKNILKSNIQYGENIFISVYCLPSMVDSVCKNICDCFADKIKVSIDDETYYI